MDWRQLWEICSAPDNVPIVGLIPLLCFYIYLAWKQAHANDQLIAQLEADPALAKTHHRKTWPFKPGCFFFALSFSPLSSSRLF